jgi:DNA end-binding protein Ku
MAPRAYWKGYLKFSLVSCPVAMSPATSEREKLRFHTINAETGHRVQSRYVDGETGDPLEEEDEVRGYPIAGGRFVLLEEEELEAVALESTRTIDIETFVPRDSIGWIWLDAPHYLVPDDKAGEEAYAVIREAMRATETVGVARLVLYRRERAVMIEPRGKGIVLWTLRYGDEVRHLEAAVDGSGGEKPDAKALALFTKLIEERTRPWSPEMVQDPVQAKLVEIIESKKKRKKPPTKARSGEAAADTTNVVSIMDALRKSVEADKGRRSKR